MNIGEFLETVITTDSGYLNILIGPPTGAQWYQEWFRWPDDRDNAIAYIKSKCSNNNVYFSAHLFSGKDSHKQYVLPTRTIQADLDEADVSNLTFPPTVLVKTSSGRHQGYWILEDSLSLDELEELSKRLTYSIIDCDHSGWALGKRVRLPETFNHKYDPPQEVEVIKRDDSKRYQANDLLGSLPQVAANEPTIVDADRWVQEVSENPPTFSKSPQTLIDEYRGRLPSDTYAYYSDPKRAKEHREKRSGLLWSLMVSLFEAKATREEVFFLAKHSAYNKFADRQHSADRDLAKDVDRAYRHSKVERDNAKAQVMAIMRGPGHPKVKKEAIAQLVNKDMRQRGDFYVTDDNDLWYLRADTGQPLSISQNSEALNAYIEIVYGLNSTDIEHKYTVQHLMSYTREYGKRGVSGSLSYYHSFENALLVHGGKKDVYVVTSDGIHRVDNGTRGILFPWRSKGSVFIPRGEPQEDWTQDAFADYFNNLSGMTHEQANTLIRVWLMFLLMRNIAINRPILALFGQPGAGKSTLFRVLYTILYGQGKSLESVTNADNFDSAVSTDPLVVLDNVDTWASWLPDKLALSAATSEATKRKLYTDSDTVTLKRQAMIGVTAHNPRFGREDVVDRMLLMFFNRIEQWKSETVLIDNILRTRDNIWRSLLEDARKVVASPMPSVDDIPQFRITDFARYGLWISRALGIEQSFRDALEASKTNQMSFNLSEEDILIDALNKWVAKRPNTIGEYYSVGRLWEALTHLDMDGLIQKRYRSPNSLGKKLWVLQETLNSVFIVEWKAGASGSRLWRIDPR